MGVGFADVEEGGGKGVRFDRDVLRRMGGEEEGGKGVRFADVEEARVGRGKGVRFVGGGDSDDESDVEMGMEEYMRVMDSELRGAGEGLSRMSVSGEERKKKKKKKKGGGRRGGGGGGGEGGGEEEEEEEEEREFAVPSRVEVVMDEGGSEEDSEGSECEEMEVRVDARMVENLLESFRSQQGQSGPASNLLGRLGVL
ncbi:hypothetical protein HDU67_002399 [Dinochytrium kinnereticum]|nr:hypothetical protein HDU67_002399 [Dinochytrium kinnereticum]